MNIMTKPVPKKSLDLNKLHEPPVPVNQILRLKIVRPPVTFDTAEEAEALKMVLEVVAGPAKGKTVAVSLLVREAGARTVRQLLAELNIDVASSGKLDLAQLAGKEFNGEVIPQRDGYFTISVVPSAPLKDSA